MDTVLGIILGFWGIVFSVVLVEMLSGLINFLISTEDIKRIQQKEKTLQIAQKILMNNEAKESWIAKQKGEMK
jgi:dipeptide/tripeptide permease